MRNPVGRIWRSAPLVSCELLLIASLSYAQQDSEPGRSIGNVWTRGDLIVAELHDGVLRQPRLGSRMLGYPSLTGVPHNPDTNPASG